MSDRLVGNQISTARFMEPAEVACPKCGAAIGEKCCTKRGDPHAVRGHKAWYDSTCRAELTRGRWDESCTYFCDKPLGHAPPHSSTFEWTDEEAEVA